WIAIEVHWEQCREEIRALPVDEPVPLATEFPVRAVPKRNGELAEMVAAAFPQTDAGNFLVIWHSQADRWRARIGKGNGIWFGRYKTMEAAVKAADLAEANLLTLEGKQ